MGLFLTVMHEEHQLWIFLIRWSTRFWEIMPFLFNIIIVFSLTWCGLLSAIHLPILHHHLYIMGLKSDQYAGHSIQCDINIYYTVTMVIIIQKQEATFNSTTKISYMRHCNILAFIVILSKVLSSLTLSLLWWWIPSMLVEE